MAKKLVTYSSPKEYQPNREPRRIHKVKPKQVCKKYKGKHQMEETKRTYYKYFPRNGKMTVFIDKRCTGCGHKEVDWERDVPLDEEKL